MKALLLTLLLAGCSWPGFIEQPQASTDAELCSYFRRMMLDDPGREATARANMERYCHV